MMNLLERVAVLKRCEEFVGVGRAELLVMAEACVERSVPPGGVVLRAGEVPPALFVLARGAVMRGTDDRVSAESGEVSPRVFDIPALLLGRPLDREIVADEILGATCLLMTKAGFHTMVSECPVIMVNTFKPERTCLLDLEEFSWGGER